MKFTKELADMVAETQNVPIQTVRVWAHRGKIPDWRLDEAGAPRPAKDIEPISSAQLRALSDFYTAAWVESKALPNIRYNRIRAGVEGKENLMQFEYREMKRQFVVIRNEWRKVFETKTEEKRRLALRAFLMLPQIRQYAICGGFDRTANEYIIRERNQHLHLDPERVEAKILHINSQINSIVI